MPRLIVHHDLPDPVIIALRAADAAALRVEELDADLDAARDAYYAAIRSAVQTARDHDVPGPQQRVAEALELSRQRVSELAARAPVTP